MTRNLGYLSLFTALLISTSLFAAEVTKVKGGNALVDLKGDSASPGDTFYTLSSDGKKRGIVQITKVRDDKAIVKIVKGKVEEGMVLQARPGNAGKVAKHAAKDEVKGRPYWGAMLGVSDDSMKVQVNNAANNPFTSASLSGVSFSAMGLFDYELYPQIWFRGLGGVESFSVSGSSVCGVNNTQACNANIYYLSFDFLARYVFSKGPYRPWAGAGVALMFPASKNATALSSSSISTTSVLQVAAGFDWFLSPTFFIPLSIEYGHLPSSSDVSASWIEFRAGVGVPF